MLKDTEKRVIAGGFDQLPVLDIEQVQGKTRQVPLMQGLRDLLKLLSYSLTYWKQILISTFLMIGGGLLSSAGILLLAPILTLLLNPAAAGKTPVSEGFSIESAGMRFLDWLNTFWDVREPSQQLFALCCALTFVVTFRSICLFSGRWIAWSVQIKTFYKLQRDVFEHVLRQSLAFFYRNRVGSLISEIQTNVTAIVGPIQKIISDLLSTPLLLLFYFVLMFRTSPRLTIVTVSVAAITALLSHRAGVWLRGLKRSQLSQNAIVTALMQEAFYGIRVVKSFGAERYEADRYSAKTMDYLQLEKKQMIGKFAEEPVMAILGIVALSTIVVQGASMVLAGTLSFTSLLMFLVIAQQCMAPLASFGSMISSTFSVLGASERVLDLLKEKISVQDGPQTLAGFKQVIRFENVSFRYGQDPVLTDVSIDFRAGETVALVGPSGGGKSTLVDLLLRFHDPSSGRITIDGHDIREFTQESYRKIFGVVPQETILFNDSVRRNVSYGRVDVSQEQLLEAAQIANADSFIQRMPENYDTYIGDRGVRLSGGERQRLSIARAVLSHPAIMVFDEATSALDNKSERLVQEAIDRVSKGRTAVVIAHRLSTVQRADRILVIDGGRVVEEGTHSALIERSGIYRKLYELQFAQEASL